MRMILSRYQMLSRGIHPQSAASTRCLSPSWTEVTYTRIIPDQKTAAATATISSTWAPQTSQLIPLP